MRRTGLLLVAALALALAGTAAADSFVVVPSAGGDTPAPTASAGAALPGSPTVGGDVQLSTLRGLWEAAGQTYGIPWQVLAAINKIETDFGRNQGPSSAGAVGWMQFMPSTWLRWGTDANGDGVADPANPADAIYSAARYLAAAGGQTDLRRAIFAYNHADWYVNEVLGLASLYAQGGVEAVFSLDRLQAAVDASRQDVSATSSDLVAAVARARALARAERRLTARADTAPALSTRLDARKRSLQVGLRRDAADRRVADLRLRLASAREQLAAARDRARGASFAAAAAQLLSAPVYQGGYVFPVGGGPGSVSVSAGHHDYPAADIAAPEGAPVYALADALVDRAWAAPEGNCGIGATLTTADGQTWTYCHLSFLDPGVHAGATLAAGASVGLVGQTGHATGPHLHLQLDPTNAFPQDQPWFRAFAGTAFRWQSELPGRALASVAAPAPGRPLFVQIDEPTVSFTAGPAGGDGSVAFSQDVFYFTR